MTPILQITILIAAALNAGSVSAPNLGTDDIVSRMVRMDEVRRTELQSYVSTRRYYVENKRFNKSAEMTVRMKYTYPGSKSYEVISQSGSGTIRKKALEKIIEAEVEAADEQHGNRSRIIPENYDFQLLGTELWEDRPCYVLQITPKTANKFLMVGRIWVDSEDFAVAHLEGNPAKNPSFWTTEVKVAHQYKKHGDVWLPESNYSRSKVRIFGATELTIDYFEYQINGQDEAPESANASKQ